MSAGQADSAAVIAVEAIMLEKYKTEPFHNLYLLYGKRPWTHAYGGTCSDKALSFLQAARHAGFDARLHSGYIGGKEIHRLVKVYIDGRSFFADVGNGWPALKLYPLDREVSHDCFGMRFRTEIRGQRMTVFHFKNGAEARQLEIDLHGRPESEIEADIAARFDSGIEYPFSKSLRFSQVIDDRFLFLRGERLEIRGATTFEVVEGIDAVQVPGVLREHFGFDVESLLSGPVIPCRPFRACPSPTSAPSSKS